MFHFLPFVFLAHLNIIMTVYMKQMGVCAIYLSVSLLFDARMLVLIRVSVIFLDEFPYIVHIHLATTVRMRFSFIVCSYDKIFSLLDVIDELATKGTSVCVSQMRACQSHCGFFNGCVDACLLYSSTHDYVRYIRS